MDIFQTTTQGGIPDPSGLNALAAFEPTWVLAFGPEPLLRQAHAALLQAVPGAVLMGCSTAGEISSGGVGDDSLTLSAVRWAMPLYSGIQRVRIDDGSLKTVQLLGIDSASLVGAPTRMIAGNLEDLRLPNTVVIDELASTRLAKNPKQPIKIGDRFEINDIEARVVGICLASRSFTGGPYIWTTYERALQYTPASRKMLSAVLAAPVVQVPRARPSHL